MMPQNGIARFPEAQLRSVLVLDTKVAVNLHVEGTKDFEESTHRKVAIVATFILGSGEMIDHNGDTVSKVWPSS
jgi:hypothetical protein